MSEMVKSDMSEIAYQINIESRNYAKWKVVNTKTFDTTSLTFDPWAKKLFHGDTFHFIENKNTGSQAGPEIREEIKFLHSSVRQLQAIPGVMVLHDRKTYGTYNKKDLVRVIPDDSRLPHFLVPYTQKQIGFSKVFYNKFITFAYADWNTKHPRGVITQTIGDVNELANFYEYQLFCRSLNASIQKFQHETVKKLKAANESEWVARIVNTYKDATQSNNCVFQDRRETHHVFSIDPKNTQDYDDAFSVHRYEELYGTSGEADDSKLQKTTIVSVYIANVVLWLEALQLWKSFSERVATIYLPDRKRPMMPTLLSESLCSLQQGEARFAFTMDVFILNGEIIDVRFVNSVIRVAHNYVYDEPSLMKSSKYCDLKILTREILKTKQHNYIHSAKTSHDVVEFWMIFMNHYCSLVMNRYNRESKNIPSVGIYRSVKILQNEDISNKPETLDEETQKFIRIWKNTSGQYVIGTPDGGHDTIGVQSYIHITSPIRRLVDLLNMIMIQSSLRLVTLSKDAQMFLENWLSKIELINTTMRSIRKVQMDCSLLELCSRNPDICNRKYRGCIFDKLEHHSGLYQYIVYISELKIVSRITCREDMKEYSNAMFAIYLFQDQDKLRQRIRVHFVES